MTSILIRRTSCDGGCGKLIEQQVEHEKHERDLPDNWMQLTITLWRLGATVHHHERCVGHEGDASIMVTVCSTACAGAALVTLRNAHLPEPPPLPDMTRPDRYCGYEAYEPDRPCRREPGHAGEHSESRRPEDWGAAPGAGLDPDYVAAHPGLASGD